MLMKAVILAAGLGQRLKPLTNNMSKSMIPVCGKPILEYIISELIDCGFNDFCLVVGHEQESIKNYFQNGNTFGIQIQYIEQKELKGTAHAIMLTKDFVGNEPFLVYLSDTIIPEGLSKIINKMKNSSSFFDIVSSKINEKSSKNIGQIKVQNNKVTQILEKSNESISNFAWAGVAFFKNQQIFEIIQDLHISKTGEFEITEALNVALTQDCEIKNHTCKEFIDFGSVSGLIKINKFLLDKQKTKSNSNYVYVGTNCNIHEDVSLGPYVSIGNNVSIKENCVLKNSLILDNVTIEKNQKYDNSIISSDGILTTH